MSDECVKDERADRFNNNKKVFFEDNCITDTHIIQLAHQSDKKGTYIMNARAQSFVPQNADDPCPSCPHAKVEIQYQKDERRTRGAF